MGVLDVSITGLIAARTQLDITSHNISNVGTEGYTRQRAIQADELGNSQSNQYIGGGTSIEVIQRMADQFVVTQLRDSITSFSENNIFNRIASRADNLVSNESTSLSTSLAQYFAALNEGANEPTSLSLRQSILSNTNNLITRFHKIEKELRQLRSEINLEIDSAAKSLTNLGKQAAKLNAEISAAFGKTGGAIPNDLIDQRDRILGSLSKITNVAVFENNDKSVDISIGSGQSLVSGTSSLTIVAEPNIEDASEANLFVKDIKKNVKFDITNEIQGGSIKGLIDVRESIIDRSVRHLGKHRPAARATLLRSSHCLSLSV